MYLVDTSVWVDYIRGTDSPVVEFLDNLLLAPMSVGINNHIYMEILQGAKSEAGFSKLQNYFSTQHFYGFADKLYGFGICLWLRRNLRQCVPERRPVRQREDS